MTAMGESPLHVLFPISADCQMRCAVCGAERRLNQVIWIDLDVFEVLCNPCVNWWLIVRSLAERNR